MGCAGAGCLAALAVLCGALGDAPSRGKSLIPAPSGDPGARQASTGRRGLFVGAAVALGCERVPAHAGRAARSGQGLPGVARGKELGSAVAVHRSKCGMLLRA